MTFELRESPNTIFRMMILFLVTLSCDQSALAVVYDVPPTIFGESEEIGAGDTLNVHDTGVVGDFFRAHPGSTVNVYGGTIGTEFSFNGSTVNISGGTLGWTGVARESSIEMTGGSIIAEFVLRDSFMNMSGGSVGESSSLRLSTLNLSGGSLLDYFTLFPGGILNISGGSVGHTFRAVDGELNLFGTQFELGGVPIPGLVPGVPLILADREVTLTAILADGSPYELNLFTVFSGDDDTIDIVGSSAVVSITLIPEPGTLLLTAIASVALLLRRRLEKAIL